MLTLKTNPMSVDVEGVDTDRKKYQTQEVGQSVVTGQCVVQVKLLSEQGGVSREVYLHAKCPKRTPLGLADQGIGPPISCALEVGVDTTTPPTHVFTLKFIRTYWCLKKPQMRL